MYHLCGKHFSFYRLKNTKKQTHNLKANFELDKIVIIRESMYLICTPGKKQQTKIALTV